MTMPVPFHIPGALREFTGGRSEVEIGGSPNTWRKRCQPVVDLPDRMTTE